MRIESFVQAPGVDPRAPVESAFVVGGRRIGPNGLQQILFDHGVMGTQGIDGSAEAREEAKLFAKRRCARKVFFAQTMCTLVFGEEFCLGATGRGVGFNYGSAARDDHPEFHYARTDRTFEI